MEENTAVRLWFSVIVKVYDRSVDTGDPFSVQWTKLYPGWGRADTVTVDP